MAKNDFANALQAFFDTEVKTHPQAPTLLEAMAVPKSSVQKLKGKFDFRFFEAPESEGTQSTVTAEKASGTSIFESGNRIATKAFSLGNEDFKLETLYTDGYEMSKVDYGFNDVLGSAQKLAKELRGVYERGRVQFKELMIAQQLMFADEWLTGADDVALSDAITAEDTTFKVTNANAADLLAGRIVKIGNKITARSLSDSKTVEMTDVVMIKTKGAADSGGSGKTLITIETNKALFPLNLRTGRKSFNALGVALTAHASGARIQIDKPLSMSEALAPNTFNKLMGEMAKATDDEKGVLFYTNHDVITHTRGTASAVTANDFIGKELMTNGKLGEVYGATLLRTNNGICRNDGTDDVFYIAGFKRGKSFISADLMMSSAVDNMQGQAGLVDVLTWAQIVGAYAHRIGRRNMVLAPVKLT